MANEGQASFGTIANMAQWTANHAPAANTKATITKAAPGVGQRLVITAIVATLASAGGVPVPAALDVNLINGASGGTPVLTGTLSVPAVEGSAAPPLIITGLNLPFAEDTAATLEFGAAGGANSFETVTLIGYTEDI